MCFQQHGSSIHLLDGLAYWVCTQLIIPLVLLLFFPGPQQFFLLCCSLETVNIKHNSGRAKVFGALVCLGGAILLTVYKGIPLFHFSQPHSNEHHKPDMHGKWAIGSALMVLGTFCWSSWYLLQSKIGKSYPCQYSSTAIMVTFSAVQSAILSLSVDRKLSIWILKSKMDMLIIMYAVSTPSGTSEQVIFPILHVIR